MNLLHLTTHLDYGGTSAQLGLLLKHLPPTCNARVCCLGSEGVWGPRLRALGKRVDCLHWSRAVDPMPLWQLHRMLQAEPPDGIHVWGPGALRVLALVGRKWLGRTLVSRPLAGSRGRSGWIDRWLLRRVRSVAASSRAEANACRDAGVASSQLCVIYPGVELPKVAHDPIDEMPNSARRFIMCVGEHERTRGFRDAIWAFDMLRYVFRDLRLRLIGDGPQRPHLQWFAQQVLPEGLVAFLGRRADAPSLLATADVCWAPGQAGHGTQVVLEAMAAGRAVVASDQPGMREIIASEDVGHVVPPGDKVAVCRQTRRLLLDEQLRRHLGESARQHVAQRFSPQACVRSWLERYAAAA